MKEFIKLDKPRILGNNIVYNKIFPSKGIKKYFKSDFFAKYDRDIHSVDESILQIPALSNIITIAWATGADVYLKALDKKYLESLNRVKIAMKEMFPQLPFSSSIFVEEVVSNNFSNSGTLILFGGGVDSTASYLRHKGENPILVKIWGTDVALENKIVWDELKKKILEFANKESARVSFIKSNICSFINGDLLSLRYGMYLTSFEWHSGFHHGIGLSGLCAPLTAVDDTRTVYIPSTHSRDFKHPWGSHPSIDNNISWADVRVVHDSYELSRQEKIRHIIKKHIEKKGNYPFLRVCFQRKTERLNCSRCEKCARTIVGLILEGIDPNKCGFNVNGNTLNCIKKKLIKQHFHLDKDSVYMWKDIQGHIPDIVEHDLYNSRSFFEWLKNFSISESTPLHFSVYFSLPKIVQDILFYTKILQALVLLRKIFT